MIGSRVREIYLTSITSIFSGIWGKKLDTWKKVKFVIRSIHMFPLAEIYLFENKGNRIPGTILAVYLVFLFVVQMASTYIVSFPCAEIINRKTT